MTQCEFLLFFNRFLLLQNAMLLCNVHYIHCQFCTLYVVMTYPSWLGVWNGIQLKYTRLKEKPYPPTVQARGEQHPHVTKHKIQVVTLSAASGSSKLTNPKPRDLPVPSYMTCNRTGCWLEENVTNMQLHHAISIKPHLIPNKHLYTLL